MAAEIISVNNVDKLLTAYDVQNKLVDVIQQTVDSARNSSRFSAQKAYAIDVNVLADLLNDAVAQLKKQQQNEISQIIVRFVHYRKVATTRGEVSPFSRHWAVSLSKMPTSQFKVAYNSLKVTHWTGGYLGGFELKINGLPFTSKTWRGHKNPKQLKINGSIDKKAFKPFMDLFVFKRKIE